MTQNTYLAITALVGSAAYLGLNIATFFMMRGTSKTARRRRIVLNFAIAAATFTASVNAVRGKWVLMVVWLGLAGMAWVSSFYAGKTERLRRKIELQQDQILSSFETPPPSWGSWAGRS
jgi:hypothetical protein